MDEIDQSYLNVLERYTNCIQIVHYHTSILLYLHCHLLLFYCYGYANLICDLVMAFFLQASFKRYIGNL